MKPVDFLNGRVKLYQPEKGFKTSLDSVMVAASCPAQSGDRVLDLGCGVGGASFCLLERVKCSVTGVDIVPDFIELAEKNAELNDQEKSSEFLNVSVQHFQVENPGERFDHVLMNPPFLEGGVYMKSPESKVDVARGHQENITLEDWVLCGLKALLPRGSLTVTHRADHLDQIIRCFGKRFGDIEIFPLWPRQGEVASRVIVRGYKDRRGACRIHSGLILHNKTDAYTKEAEAILRHVQKLF